MSAELWIDALAIIAYLAFIGWRLYSTKERFAVFAGAVIVGVVIIIILVEVHADIVFYAQTHSCTYGYLSGVSCPPPKAVLPGMSSNVLIN